MKSPSSREWGTVWILEDSALEGEMARRALAGTNHVELFADGSSVLERIANGSVPDVLVLDWQLPGLSGVEVCSFLRANFDGMTLPILMLTVYGQKQDIVDALEVGANDYVTKPYDVAELVARVATLVRTSRLQQVQLRRSRQLALAADVGAALTRGRSLVDIAKRCVDVLVKHLDAARATLWTHGEKGIELLAVAGSDSSPLARDVIETVVARRAPVILNHTDGPGDPVAAYPLMLHGELLGVLAIRARETITPDTGDALAHTADLLTLGIARVRAESERALVLERERAARSDAEAANRSKDEFLAMVSHELRTPLNAITGWTSMLLSGRIAAERTSRALETIDRNARIQAQLIDDLLDISRIISGKLNLNMGPVDIVSVVEMARESVRLAAEAKGVRLEASLDIDAGELTGDPQRLQQVVWNLLSNAIKFTPRSGVVRLRLARDDAGIEITVEDTGQGIAEDFLPYVFDRFRQADSSSIRTQGGLGLGLAIVRHLVELHGGTVSATSEGVGKGARFTVRLQDRRAIVSRLARPSNRPSVSRFDCPKEIEGLVILVVDDEEDARDLLKALLETCKAVVHVASNAAEAFELLGLVSPDVLISDVAMPGEDGLALIRRVRELKRDEGGRIPAVALTAFARAEDRTRTLRAGFNSYVAKPIEPTELLAVLTSVATSR